MKIVWERESVTVRDVYEALLERRKIAYTTVMTMMKILEQKKYLKKTQADRAYVYRPAQPQAAGDRRHGAGVRQPRFQRFGRAAAGAPGGGAQPLARGAGRDRAPAEEAMSTVSDLEQSGRLQHASRTAGRAGGIRSRRCCGCGCRAHGWPSGISCWLTCLLLPLVRPWKQVSLTGDVGHHDAARDPCPAAPARPTMPWDADGARGRWRWARCAAGLAGDRASGGCARTAPRTRAPLRRDCHWRHADAELRISRRVTSPVTFGVAPAGDSPAGRFPELDRAMQDAILCHELLHVRAARLAVHGGGRNRARDLLVPSGDLVAAGRNPAGARAGGGSRSDRDDQVARRVCGCAAGDRRRQAAGGSGARPAVPAQETSEADE